MAVVGRGKHLQQHLQQQPYPPLHLRLVEAAADYAPAGGELEHITDCADRHPVQPQIRNKTANTCFRIEIAPKVES